MKVIARSSSESFVGWFECGETLTVLSVSRAAFEDTKFLIWSSLQEAVALFPGGDFDVVDKRLSRRWMIEVDNNGFLCLAPEAWQVDGFWERYHDGESAAEKVFIREMTLILSED